MSKKSFKRVLTCLISICTLAGTYLLGYFTFKWSLSDTEREALSIISTYEKYYYFRDNDVLDVISDAIFDDYSAYYSAEEYEKVVNNAYGQKVNLGISFLKNSLEIYEVVVNSPCYHQGITAGGTLVSATHKGVESFGENAKTVMQSLNEGDEVTIKIDYGGTVKVFNVTKQQYNESYVNYRSYSGSYSFVDGNYGMVLEKYSEEKIDNEGVGYIKYSSFNGRGLDGYGSASQMRKALIKFKEEGNTKLILDLRQNGGGYMDVTTSIASMLIDKKGSERLLTVAIDRKEKETKFYFQPDYSVEYNFDKIIVLVDKNTASASEVLVGAMLDYDDKNIVTVVVEGHEEGGETVYRSYGKGIMQTTYKNKSGSAVKLTTAKIFWPVSRTCIHGVGITTQTSSKVVNSTLPSAYDYALSIV